ncbi:hypothetical protein FEM08_21730 [Flavobacterium gilvum]|nr:hypothetical protein FEM08_21730 [Flavobacterium gilvum]
MDFFVISTCFVIPTEQESPTEARQRLVILIAELLTVIPRSSK